MFFQPTLGNPFSHVGTAESLWKLALASGPAYVVNKIAHFISPFISGMAYGLN